MRRIVRTKDGAYFHKSLGVSYSTTRDECKKYIWPFVIDPGDYCLHTLKSGGASNDGYKLSDPELKERHTGWKNPCTKYGLLALLFGINTLLHLNVKTISSAIN